MIEAIVFRGGPLDGRREDRSDPPNFSEGMTFEGEPYAPIEAFTDAGGVQWLVLGHDPTGQHGKRALGTRLAATRPQMLEWRGGPAHATREPVHEGFHPELYLIETQDGAAYARTDEVRLGDDGVARTVFRFDPDGSLTEAARLRYTNAPA
jgi:hypothetical protein